MTLPVPPQVGHVRTVVIHPELERISDPKKKAEEADRLRAELVKERVKKERIKNDGRQQSNQNEDR